MDPSLSGGHPVHNGTHAVDTAVWLLGRRPVRVFCRGLRTWAPDTQTPDSFSVTVRFDDGSLALLELCYALRQPGAMLRRLVLCGELGTLHHDTSDDPGTVVPGGVPGAPASIEGALDVQLRHWVDTLLLAGHPEMKVVDVVEDPAVEDWMVEDSVLWQRISACRCESEHRRPTASTWR